MESSNFLEIQVSKDATVQDVMDRTLSDKGYPHTAYPSECYAMRLMDEPGLADFDMPSLDRKRQINKFGAKSFVCA